MFNLETLRSKSIAELTKIAKDLGVKTAKNSDDNTIIFAILDFQASNTKVAKDYFNATEKSNTTDEPAAETPKPVRKQTTRKKAAAAKEPVNSEETPAAAKPENEEAETEQKSSIINDRREKKCIFSVREDYERRLSPGKPPF